MRLDLSVPRCGHANPFGCPNHGHEWRLILADALDTEDVAERMEWLMGQLERLPIPYALTTAALAVVRKQTSQPHP